jgi:hypothetical protein
MTAQDWLEGTDLLMKEQVDLLLVDLAMPVFDGQEFIRKIRSDFRGTFNTNHQYPDEGFDPMGDEQLMGVRLLSPVSPCNANLWLPRQRPPVVVPMLMLSVPRCNMRCQLLDGTENCSARTTAMTDNTRCLYLHP